LKEIFPAFHFLLQNVVEYFIVLLDVQCRHIASLGLVVVYIVFEMMHKQFDLGVKLVAATEVAIWLV